jgi:hypothetical protein
MKNVMPDADAAAGAVLLDGVCAMPVHPVTSTAIAAAAPRVSRVIVILLGWSSMPAQASPPGFGQHAASHRYSLRSAAGATRKTRGA